jgi:L-2-hydroxyglutarate oxidase LhgO
MDKVDCVVVGAGVVGLAVARSLARQGREVFVLDKHAAAGMETSSRNSEVIHAGLYYPTGSLKATLCLEGRDALYTYCENRGIAYRRCGKLIVATSSTQLEKLSAIHNQALANGCREVVYLSAEEANALEPDLACVAALYSPQTGILDTHAYMLSLQADAEGAGALFAFNGEALGGSLAPDGITLHVRSSDGTETELMARTVINCGGLWAPRFALHLRGLDQSDIPTPYFAKGNYYALAGKAPFSHLIYPVPETGGLGVHLTLDLGGQARFGPDVEWLENTDGGVDYTVDPQRADRFYREIRTYWPKLEEGALHPAYSGIRPKIAGPTSPAADFLFSQHGCPHYLGLYGIESPGLTASLAIAEHVATIMAAK